MSSITNFEGKRAIVDNLAVFEKIEQNRGSFLDILHAVTNEGRTVLHTAIERNRSFRDILSIVQVFPSSIQIRCNEGLTPLDLALLRGADSSVLWVLFQYLEKFIVSEDHRLLYNAARITRGAASVNVHLLGHGFAGKTTCRRAMTRAVGFGFYDDIVVDRSNGLGQTQGMEMDFFNFFGREDFQCLIRDYGGQEDFHVNHARFLFVPGSIFVIIVALWDAEKQCRLSIEDIRNRYVYWLKFLNSIAEKGTNWQCITVINFSKIVGKDYTDACVEAIRLCNHNWVSKESSLTLRGDPCVLSVNKVSDARVLKELFQEVPKEASVAMINESNFVSALCEIYDVNSQVKLMLKVDFVKSVCMPAMCSLLKVDSLPADVKHVDIVTEKMIEYLCLSGKILVVPTSASCDNPLIVMDINWLSKEILGALVKHTSLSIDDNHLFTADELYVLSNASKYFEDAQSLVSFLENIGCCIAVSDPIDKISRWFPICGQRKFVPGKECVSIDRGNWICLRKVARMFELSDSHHQMFPPGYFVDLFLKILSTFPMKTSTITKVFTNGLDVIYELEDARLQMLLKVFDNSKFSLEACLVSNDRAFDRKLYWARFQQVCDLILNPIEVFTFKDIIRVTPWFDNVKLTEQFVDPRHDANFQVQERQTKVLSELEGCDHLLYNLFVYGCDENDQPVDVHDFDSKLEVFDEQKLEIKKSSDTRLGKGTFGIVFRGSYDGVAVAIKYILDEFEATIVKEFKQELANLSKVQHLSGVIKLFGVDNINEPKVIMLELAMCSLDQLLHNTAFDMTKQRLSPIVKIRFVRQLTETLTAFTSMGMRHRDIKPANILVTFSLACKLSDFGTARVYDEEAKSIYERGTPEYNSPEVRQYFLDNIDSKPPDDLYGEKSDVYSYGVTVNEFFSERKPFYKAPRAWEWDTTKRPALYDEQEDIRNIILSCWETSPVDRPTFANIVELLKKVSSPM